MENEMTEKTHTFFLKIGEEMMQKWSLKSVWVSFSWKRNGEDSEQSQNVEGKTEKVLKIVFEMQNTRFSRLKQVANKSPGQAAKTLKVKIMKNISKCFSRLEGLPARESRAEPRKSLCTPRDSTLHLQTSRQT